METDRPHRSNSINNSSSSSNSATSELFICFTSRLSSSSSMKIPSKSLLSPGRPREGSQISLSNSLSRRLRSSASMKGQASPMFPTNGKKRGCSFENPEPSSPKVTCIGQVRVKTKKQGNKIRARSKRGGVDVSFRRLEQSNASNGVVDVGNSNTSNNENMQELNEEGLSQNHPRNQRWVDLPVTICEALRTFGAELNCFLPCRSSCMAGEKVKEEGSNGGNNFSNKENSSCGAVFRWLVAVDGEGKGREIELVVGEEEEEEGGGSGRRRSYRRHVFDEMEFSEEKVEKDNSVEEESGRVSICIPPKNALLLMRCRSDPVKMAALSNKFWEPTLPNDEEVEEEETNGEVAIEHKVENGCVEVEEKEEKAVVLVEEELLENQENVVVEKSLSWQENDVSEVGEFNDEDFEESREDIDGHVEEEEKEEEESPVTVTCVVEADEGEVLAVADPGNEDEEMVQVQESQHVHQEQQITESVSEDIQQVITVSPIQTEEDSDVIVTETLPNQEPEHNEEPEPPEPVSLESLLVQQEEETPEGQEPEETAITEEKPDPLTHVSQTGRKSTERESQAILPDCLLLMMCEPKLSMEVSKETWVCSTDFIRWLPEHSKPPVNKKNGGDEPKKRISIDVNPPPVHRNNANNDGGNNNNVLQQPPRSSCSYPAKPPPRAGGAQSMATAIEQKLVNSKGFEPFVLTRCKSEPMRTASKLAPEPCFWKNRKLEPHRPATVGIGAAGVGC